MRQYRVCDSIDAYEFEKSLDKVVLSLIEWTVCQRQKLAHTVILTPKKKRCKVFKKRLIT